MKVFVISLFLSSIQAFAVNSKYHEEIVINCRTRSVIDSVLNGKDEKFRQKAFEKCVLVENIKQYFSLTNATLAERSSMEVIMNRATASCTTTMALGNEDISSKAGQKKLLICVREKINALLNEQIAKLN